MKEASDPQEPSTVRVGLATAIMGNREQKAKNVIRIRKPRQESFNGSNGR
jgi:hypothetical protein